ncbi:MAG: hypothetical protein IPK74_01605 [Deltaproteobacteria bacterium]|nr:hypothetical protein [Deltaproteobacteria bacterium]
MRELAWLLGWTMGAAVMAGGCDPKGDGGEDGGGGGGGGEAAALQEAIEICAPWAQTYAACYAQEAAQDDGYAPGYVSLVGECVAGVGTYASAGGVECRAALSDYFACMAALDCEEIIGSDSVEAGGDTEGSDPDGGGAGVEVEPPCAAQEQVIEQECDFGAVDSPSVGSASDEG